MVGALSGSCVRVRLSCAPYAPGSDPVRPQGLGPHAGVRLAALLGDREIRPCVRAGFLYIVFIFCPGRLQKQ